MRTTWLRVSPCVGIMAEAASCRGRGRPRRCTDTSARNLTIRMTGQERADMETVARDSAMSLSEVVREAVNEFVADYRERAVFETPRRRVVSCESASLR